MKKLTLHSELPDEYIELPITFIDRYMPQAPVAALKLYLYLLRASRDPSILLSVSDLADLFDVTPNQIQKAFSYWEELGLLALTTRGNELTDIRLLPIPSEDAEGVDFALEAYSEPEMYPEAEAYPEPEVSAAPAEAPAAVAPVDLNEVYQEDAFIELLHLQECYTSREVTGVAREILADCYLMFDRQSDVIEFLLEYCVEQGKTSPYYIRTVARNWKEDGLADLKAIRKEVNQRSAASSRYNRVANAYGLKRSLVNAEREYCDRWYESFTEDLIIAAIDRTMLLAHQPSFQYTDSVLKGWEDAGVKTLEDVAKQDEAYRSQKKAKIAEESEAVRQEKVRRDKERAASAKKTSFHTMDQRKDSYSSLIPSAYEK